jgi:hypothetical protein
MSTDTLIRQYNLHHTSWLRTDYARIVVEPLCVSSIATSRFPGMAPCNSLPDVPTLQAAAPLRDSSLVATRAQGQAPGTILPDKPTRPTGQQRTTAVTTNAGSTTAANYWSLGKTTPFIADIMDVEALQKGFQGRAYNKELVLLNGDSSPRMLEMVMSAVFKYRDLGFDHWIMVVSAQASCLAAQVRRMRARAGQASQ